MRNIVGTLLLLLTVCAVFVQAQPAPEEIIPFGEKTQWLHYSRTKLSNFSASDGKLDFSNKHAFDGDHALRWCYQPGGILTYKVTDFDSELAYFNFHSKDPRWKVPPLQGADTRMLFNLSLLAPGPGLIGKKLTIEFMTGDKVFAKAPFTFYRPHWNRWEMGRERGAPCDFVFEGGVPEHLKEFTSVICKTGGIPITAIRITAPQDSSGEIYLGFLYWGPFGYGGYHSEPMPFDYDITTGNATLLDSQPQDSASPAPTSSELAGLEVVEQRVEKSILYNTSSTGLVEIKDTDEWFEKIKKDYGLYDIHRTAGGMRGRNISLRTQQVRTGQDTSVGLWEHEFSQLMYAASICFRWTKDPVRKDELREIYYDLYDYSVYVGGMPNSWYGGEGYMESVYLMRKDLNATHRLTFDLVRAWSSRFGYQRIFNSKERIDLKGRIPENITIKGEDCDYMRITMPGLILYSLLQPGPAQRVQHLHAFSDWLGNVVLEYAPGKTGTLKPDGTTFHHGVAMYGYGKLAMFAAARMLQALSQTDFAVKAKGHSLLKEVLLKQHNFSYGNYLPASFQGKDGFAGKNWDHPVPLGAYCLMALSGSPDGKANIDTEMASVYRRMMADGDNQFLSAEEQKGGDKLFADMGIPIAPKTEGHWTQSYNASAIHRRPDWQLFIKGYSKYFYARESGHSFKPGTLLGFGLCELRTPGMVAPNVEGKAITVTTNFGHPGYDWMKLPGTTMVQIPMTDLKGIALASTRTFVGGVDAPDGNGVFVLDLDGPKACGLENFKAKKTWFCFGDTVVCLGSSITDSHAESETQTTLFQNQIPNSKMAPTFVNETSGISDLPFKKDQTASTWLVDSISTGYYTFDNQDLQIRRQTQICRDPSDKRDAKGVFELAWLSHGKAPTDASYRYLMRPMTTPAKMAEFAKEMQTQAPIEILRQDDDAHIVRSRADDSTGYVLYNAALPLADGILLSASKPCVILLRHSADALHCSIADPDLRLPYDPEHKFWGYSQPSTITLTFHGKWKGQGAFYPNYNETKITLRCNDGLTTTVKLLPE